MATLISANYFSCSAICLVTRVPAQKRPVAHLPACRKLLPNRGLKAAAPQTSDEHVPFMPSPGGMKAVGAPFDNRVLPHYKSACRSRHNTQLLYYRSACRRGSFHAVAGRHWPTVRSPRWRLPASQCWRLANGTQTLLGRLKSFFCAPKTATGAGPSSLVTMKLAAGSRRWQLSLSPTWHQRYQRGSMAWIGCWTLAARNRIGCGNGSSVLRPSCAFRS